MAASRRDEVKKQLLELQNIPVAAPSDDVLRLVATYLLGNISKPENPAKVVLEHQHWFCSQADDLTRDAATFCIRLHAYNSSTVEVWRIQLKRVLLSCCNCVRGLHDAEGMSRHTFFGAFSDGIIQKFYDNFHGFLTDVVVQALAEKGLTQSPGDPARSLADAPAAATYLLVTYLHMLKDPRIVGLIHTHCPREPIRSWPLDIAPSALLALLFDGTPNVTSWARSQTELCNVHPIPMESFSSEHMYILKAVSSSLAESKPLPECLGSEYKISPLKDVTSVWASYTPFLRFVPVELFRASNSFDLDIRHIIVGHLHDTGKQFMDVLKSFAVLLTRMGSDIWKDEGQEYAHVVFNSIKDNTQYAEVLCNISSPAMQDDWRIRWMESYTSTVAKLQAFPEILPSVLQFLCEQLQHERFQRVRPNAMSTAAKLLYAVMSPRSQDSSSRSDLAFYLLGVHSAVFVSVAFGGDHSGEPWAGARKQTRKLLKDAMDADIKSLLASVTSLCRLKYKQGDSTDRSPSPVSPTVHEQVWKNTYEGIVSNDSEAIALLFSVLVQIAHVDDLKTSAFEDAFKKISDQDKGEARKALTTVNSALGTIRLGFREVLNHYADFSRSAAATELLKRDGVVPNVVRLMFSPVEALQEAAQSIVALAYDVDSRLDCFGALLEHFPDATFSGIAESLRVYTEYAQIVPEACSLSQALARCLTDVIECLSSTPDGLLIQMRYLDVAGSVLQNWIPKWWKLMTDALCVIFARTPAWALYFDNEVMVLWMRDALIFGRDLLAQRRLLERGAVVFTQKEMSKGSADEGNKEARKVAAKVSSRMVDSLQPVLYELIKWLRLTDRELLHQSFALLETLLQCFHDKGTRPQEKTFERIRKHIEDARNTKQDKVRSRLDEARVLRLQEALGAFDDDDEVTIVAHTLAPKTETKSKLDVKAKAETRRILKVSDTKSKAVDIRTAKGTIGNYFSAPELKRKRDDDTRSRASTSSSTTATLTNVRYDLPRPATEPLIKNEGAKVKPIVPKPEESSSSSEESSEDEDDVGPGNGLAALSKLQRTPMVKKPVERRQVKMLDIAPDGRMARIDQARKRADDARRTHLRLKPDVSALYRTLLSWNYEHNGLMPPGSLPKMLSVPRKFDDYAHFRRVFEPMLLLELWNELQESKEGPLESYEARIANRQYTDEYIDLDVAIEGGPPKEWALSDTDIVLLSKAGSKQRVLAKTQSYRATPMGVNATLRYSPGGADAGVLVGTTWAIAKVLSLTTLIREYAALMALPHYDLLDSILYGRLPRAPTVNVDEIRRVMETYSVNEPQANAILKSLNTDGFALIQGPPGTGKTSTICGLVHLYLVRRSRTIGRPGDKESPKKILLCAPSNAAIDEIATRLKDGVSGAGHRKEPPKIVRIGSTKSMNVGVREVSLEYLMDQKLNSHPELQNTKEAGSEVTRVRNELESVKKQRQAKLDEMAAVHDNGTKLLALEEEFKKLNRQKAMLTHQLDKVRDKQKSDYRTLDASRRRFRNEVLQEADVICSTLSASSYEYLEPFEFEVVIIDEAAQAIELSSLIPMKYRCRTCIMVGDPQQLPPTVKSQEACRLGYDQSLFVRLQQSQPEAVHLLSIQYRMHPDISQLPSNLFYDGRLRDGPDMAEKTIRPWHSHPKFGTYRFFSVEAGIESSAPGTSHSLVNQAEVQVAVALYNRLVKDFTSSQLDFRVGVISMYRGQIAELRKAFRQRFGEEVLSTVDFNTVDGFQGQEKDIIILSCVRAGKGLTTVGFLRDVRRMNVALTRSKASLFILGNAPTLERSDEIWRKIVENARTRSSLVKVDVAYFTAPISGAYTKVAATPAKKSSRRPSDVTMSPPANLVTPREIKSLANRSAVVTSSASEPPSVATPTLETEIAAPAAALPTAEAHVGQKRRAEDVQKEEASGSRTVPGGQRPRPRPPPAKRQKQAGSLFIPKKKS